MTAAVMTESPPGVASNGDRVASSENRAVVTKFYRAVNDVLATGNARSLDGLLAPNFRHDLGLARTESSRDGLVRDLLAIRAIDPSFQIVVEEIDTGDRWVLAHVRESRATNGTFLGILLPADELMWGTADLFEIASGHILGLQRFGTDGALREPLGEVQVEAPRGPLAVTITRLALAPGAETPWLIDPGPALISVEEGAIEIRGGVAPPLRVGDATPEASLPSRTVLEGGGMVGLPAGVPFVLHNPGTIRATALGASLLPSGETLTLTAFEGENQRRMALFGPEPTAGSFGQSTSLPEGVTVDLLGSGIATNIAPGPILLAIGRVALSSRAGVPPHEVTGAELMVIESGQGWLKMERGRARIRRTEGAPISVEDLSNHPGGVEVIIGPGGQAFLDLDALSSLHATDTAFGSTALILTVRPAPVTPRS
jgi:hypothetical protein